MGVAAPLDGFDEVLAATRRGDDRAFALLWRWLQPPLLRWLTVVARRDVEDIAAEVWLSVTRALDSFEGDGEDFRRWVFTIARRRAIDRARRRARRLQAGSLEGVDPVDGTASSTALVDASESLAAALGLLQQLTPDQREVVALRVIVGMTVPETAAVVGKSDVAVRVLCHRGLQALARLLEGQTLVTEVSA